MFVISDSQFEPQLLVTLATSRDGRRHHSVNPAKIQSTRQSLVLELESCGIDSAQVFTRLVYLISRNRDSAHPIAMGCFKQRVIARSQIKKLTPISAASCDAHLFQYFATRI
jgi:hypothetical protein